MPFTSFFANSRSCAIFSMSCDFVIWDCISTPAGDSKRRPYFGNHWKTGSPRRFTQLCRRTTYALVRLVRASGAHPFMIDGAEDRCAFGIVHLDPHAVAEIQIGRLRRAVQNG